MIDPLEQADVAEAISLRKQVRAAAVPTDNVRVCEALRLLGEPITLFGERKGDRRERLARIYVQLQGKSSNGLPLYLPTGNDNNNDNDEDEDEDDTPFDFYTRGGRDLLVSRRNIAASSVARAALRLSARRHISHSTTVLQRRKSLQSYYETIRSLENVSVQFGDQRPLTSIMFSRCSRYVASGSWSGTTSLWKVASSDGNTPMVSEEPIHRFAPHGGRVSSIDYLDDPVMTLATSAADGTVLLHRQNGNVDDLTNVNKFGVNTLPTHPQRVAKVKFLPRFNGNTSGDGSVHLASTCFDRKFRLIDVNRSTVVLEQDGHQREAFGLAVHPDGSLLATGGKDAMCRVWDLRSGRSVMVLQGHAKQIISMDFHSNGTSLATGSEDNSIRIWDIRAASCRNVIPAHTNIVSNVKYLHSSKYGKLSELFGEDGGAKSDKQMDSWLSSVIVNDIAEEGMTIDDNNKLCASSLIQDSSVLVSSSYDGTCKLWAAGSYSLIKSLVGLEGKIMSCDIAPDGTKVATASYDRTFKIYSPMAF